MPSELSGPLVTLHAWPPGSAGDIGFRRLVGELRTGGIEVITVDGPHEELPTTMAAWVDDFDRKLTALEIELGERPALLGYCMSAFVALELMRRRPAPEYVGLIDMWFPRLRLGRGDYRRYKIPRRRIPGELMVQRYATPDGSWRTMALTHAREFKHYRHQRRHEPERAAELDAPAALAIYQAALRHRPSACQVPLHLYPTVRSMATRTEGDTTLGWARYLQGGYRATVVPGNHVSCFDEDNLPRLTAAIRHDLGFEPAT